MVDGRSGEEDLLYSYCDSEVDWHKKGLFHVGFSSWYRCLGGRLRLVPDEGQLEDLKADFDVMRAAAILGDEAPGFDALIEEICTLEADANRQG